jgi:hypothetical protein
MASNKKRPTNKKNKIVVKPATKKPVANKKVTVKPVAKKLTVKKQVAKKPVVKPAEVKVEQVSIAEQIPASIYTCEKSCKKASKTKYVIAGVIIVALLLALIF